MKKSILLLSMASVFALTGCHGTKKVTFKEFCDGVDKAEEAPKMKAIKLRGKVDGEKVNFTYEFASSVGGLIDAVIDLAGSKYNDNEKAALAVFSAAKHAGLYTLAENEECEYYVGNGFKVVNGKSKIEWDKYALFASAKDGETSLSASWVKA